MYLSRRKFLTFSALTPIAIASGKSKFILKQNVTKKYVHIALYGAPARWLFDNPLRLNKNDPFIKNRMVVNAFDKNLNPTYMNQDWEGFNLPIHWSYKIPGTNGSRNTNELLPNMNIFRGVQMNSIEHGVNGYKLSAPVTGGTSFNGVLADSSPYLLKSVLAGVNSVTSAYRSNTGLPGILISDKHGGENYLSNILDSFVEDKTPWKRSESVRNIASIIGNFHITRTITKELKDKIEKEYQSGRIKYKDLVSKALYVYKYPFLNDRPIPGFKPKDSYVGNKRIEEIGYDFWYRDDMYVGDDMREIFTNVTLAYWTDYFALAEVLLRHDLTNNITLSPMEGKGNTLIGGTKKNFLHKDSYKTSYDKNLNTTKLLLKKSLESNSNKFNLEMDSHIHGRVTYLVGNALFYLSFNAMLLEFVDSLKRKKVESGKSLFDETLIHFTAEYGRLPHNTLPESGHNAKSHVSTFISGSIKNFNVCGNIHAGIKNGNTPGTYGNGAENKQFGLLSYDHIISSVSEFFNVPSLVKRKESLIKMEGGEIKSLLERGKVV
jgi:hypothetical protein